MRFLGVGETCDLGDLYVTLKAEGHEVRVAVSEPLAQGTLAGLVDRTDDWRAELDWIRQAPDGGVVLFESVSEGFGQLQDDLRRDGLTVIGGSAYGDRLENDRAFAFDILGRLGLCVAGVREFDDPALADAFIAANPARYVLKFSGPDFASSDNYVGALEDGSDTRAYLQARAYRGRGQRFVLMDFLDGVEMGVGAYFNGRRFLAPACLDWEHKRFFAGDLGELTGEMGTVATFQHGGRFFERTLKLLEPLLAEAGHVGYVNLNTIVNREGIWPLELTCRFGYPGFAVLEPLQDIGWGELLGLIAAGRSNAFPVRPGFSVGVVLTTPPFPYSREEIDEPVGLPIVFRSPLSATDRANLHYGEVGAVEGRLVTSGLYGWTMVATGTAPGIAEARERAYALCSKIAVPNLRYRLDIADRLIERDWPMLAGLDLL
jgi:phosphoribosylamine--glycine ligase